MLLILPVVFKMFAVRKVCYKHYLFVITFKWLKIIFCHPIMLFPAVRQPVQSMERLRESFSI